MPQPERHRVSQALGKGHEAVEDGEVGWVALGPGFEVGQVEEIGHAEALVLGLAVVAQLLDEAAGQAAGFSRVLRKELHAFREHRMHVAKVAVALVASTGRPVLGGADEAEVLGGREQKPAAPSLSAVDHAGSALERA